MILGWSSFIVVQMVLVHCISRSQELNIFFKLKTKKIFLSGNHSTDFNITWQKWFFLDPLPRLFKPFGFVKKHGRQWRGWGWGGGWGWGWERLFSLYIYIENFKNLLVRNHWTDINITRQECFICNPLPRLFNPSWYVKTHGRQWRGLFSLYFYIENLKNLLVRNHWTDFNIILQKCSFRDPLPRLFKPFGFVKKHIEKQTENYLRNHWTYFNITLQKCFLGDPVPRLFKPSWFVKKHGRQVGGRGGGGEGGVGAYFPYISI